MSDKPKTTKGLPGTWEWLATFKMARMRDGSLVTCWSDDVNGLFVSGRSIDEALRKLPGAYAEIQEAKNVGQLEYDRNPDNTRDA
jgi:hypothetical protein